MKNFSLIIFCFLIILVFSVLSLFENSITESKTNTVNKTVESYLQKEAVINNKKVPYYGFNDPIEYYYDDEEKILELENREKSFSYNGENENITYRNYNNGIEIVYDGYYESIINVPSSIKGKPTIKLGGFMEDPEPIANDMGKTYYTFVNCFYMSYAKEIHIPSTVKEIVKGTFNIETLEKIVVDKNNPYYSSKNGILYNKDGTVKLCVPKSHHSKIKSKN